MSRKDDLDNHANQMNPNNDAYWESRGFDERPDDWEDRIEEEDDQPERSGKESPRKYSISHQASGHLAPSGRLSWFADVEEE